MTNPLIYLLLLVLVIIVIVAVMNNQKTKKYGVQMNWKKVPDATQYKIVYGARNNNATDSNNKTTVTNSDNLKIYLEPGNYKVSVIPFLHNQFLNTKIQEFEVNVFPDQKTN